VHLFSVLWIKYLLDAELDFYFCRCYIFCQYYLQAVNRFLKLLLFEGLDILYWCIFSQICNLLLVLGGHMLWIFSSLPNLFVDILYVIVTKL
jgi:hypothetical protein